MSVVARANGSAPKWGRVWRYEGVRGVVWRIRYRDASGRRVLETLGKEPVWDRKRAEKELQRRLVDIEREGVVRFDHGGRTFAVFRSPDDEVYCTDGLCTHERVHLADGLVMDGIIECPKHNGRFNYRTGEARGAPACVNLRTFPVRVEGGKVLLRPGAR